MTSRSTQTLATTRPGNHLIDLLPRKDRLRFIDACESVDLPLAEVLCEPGKPTKYVYFPTAGFISLLAVVKGSPGVEVGMVGREGMLGVQLGWAWPQRRCMRWYKAQALRGALAPGLSRLNWLPARRCKAACTATCTY